MMKTQNTFENYNVDVKLKLAALWTSFMFLYIYVDYFHLYMPNKLAEIMNGKVYVFEITQGFVFIALLLATIPMLMIFLSLSLNARTNRFINILVALVLIPYMLFNLTGEAWLHMFYAAIVELVILSIIIYYAWKWPRT
jgi:hypothetical protein